MYYPSADTGNDPSDYGDISPLTSHACGFPPDGVVSECCKVHPVEGICGVFWFNAFLYPCAKCNDPSIPTPMEPSTSIEPSMQPSVSTLEGTDCAYCTMYYPSAGIGPDPDPSDYGDISPLTTHACGFPPEGVVSECCKVHPVEGICGVFWFNEFLYPCAKCNIPTPMEPSTSIEPSMQPSVTSTLEGTDCAACTMYYPSGGLEDDPSDYGDIFPLTHHACGGHPDSVVSECCKLNPVQGICGVFWPNEFLYPCAKCNDPSMSPSMQPSATLQPSVAPTSVGLRFSLGSLALGLGALGTFVLF
jgi:hypothetical protein